MGQIGIEISVCRLHRRVPEPGLWTLLGIRFEVPLDHGANAEAARVASMPPQASLLLATLAFAGLFELLALKTAEVFVDLGVEQ